MSRRVVCISRVRGAGAEEVGRLVAEMLGLSYVDEEIIAQAAAKGGVSAADIADLERRKSVVSRLLVELGRGLEAETAALTGLAPGTHEEGTPEALRGLIREVVEEVASRGDVVIAAHGASFALAREEGVLRVHVTASPETRSRRLSESAGLDSKEAAKAVRDSDLSRADYLRRFYDVAAELPTHYDLVVNTDRLSIEATADLVSRAAG
jgi:cytidylate kinase